MRITTVKKARKDQGTCSRCADPIRAGDSYRWIKFRMGGRRVRCMKPECAFRRSDMTTSDKLQMLYGAQEIVEDALRVWDGGDVAPIVEALETAQQDATEASEGYNESADSQEEFFPGSPNIDDIREKAEMAEQFAEALGDEASELPDLADGDHTTKTCPTCESERRKLQNAANAERVRPPRLQTIKAHELRDGMHLFNGDKVQGGGVTHPMHAMIEVAGVKRGELRGQDMVSWRMSESGMMTFMCGADEDVQITDLEWRPVDQTESDRKRHGRRFEWYDPATPNHEVVTAEVPEVSLDCETCGGTGKVPVDQPWKDEVTERVNGVLEALEL